MIEHHPEYRLSPSAVPEVLDAPTLLRQAAELIEQRAAERDMEAERSMRRAVNAFNALTNLHISEFDGWLFMAILKTARATAGTPKPDDLLDGAAYMALALECELMRDR